MMSSHYIKYFPNCSLLSMVKKKSLYLYQVDHEWRNKAKIPASMCLLLFQLSDILFADLPGCSVFFHSKYADKSPRAHLHSSFIKNKDHTYWCSIYGNISCHTKWIFSLSDCQPLPDQTRQRQLLLLFQTLGSLSWHLHILHLQVHWFQSCQWMEIILKSRVNTNGFPVKGFYFCVNS